MEPAKTGILTLIIYAGLCCVFHFKNVYAEKRFFWGCTFFGILFSIMMDIGNKIRTDRWEFENFGKTDLLWLIFYFYIGFLLFSNLYIIIRIVEKNIIFGNIINPVPNTSKITKKKTNKQSFSF